MSQVFAVMGFLVVFVCLFGWLVGCWDICERFWQYDQPGIETLDRMVDDISSS